MRPCPQGFSSLVPAGMALPFVISTFGALKFITPEQEFDCCAQAQPANANDKSMFLDNWECTLPHFLFGC
ncbi:MAG TPA: hypothetical protein VF123_16210 [Candidatus Sulfotelmatobacter sp.]